MDRTDQEKRLTSFMKISNKRLSENWIGNYSFIRFDITVQAILRFISTEYRSTSVTPTTTTNTSMK